MDPFVAEIRMFGFNFAPTGWAQCNGQLLPINQIQVLYLQLGTDVSDASRIISKGIAPRTPDGQSWMRRGLEPT